MLTKKECKKALDDLFDDSLIEDFASRTSIKKYYILEQLIEEHFDNQFLDAEVELLISMLRGVEDELGMDITLLIDKLRRIKNTLPKEEGVVTFVEIEKEID